MTDFDLEAFCVQELNSRLHKLLFSAGFLKNVYGVELEDNRLVVVKEHPTDVGVDAVVLARRKLASMDVGCPRVLAVIDDRIVVEELVAGGVLPDPHSASDVAGMASLLARLVAANAPGDGIVGVPWVDYRHGLYPQPPGAPTDFDGTRRGVEWVDELASEASRRLRSASGPLVVGHGDWQAQNMRFVDSIPIAVFDWDSLIRDLEPAVVGFAAAMFVDVGDPAHAECANPQEWAAFVEAYEQARGLSLDRQLVASASVWVMAYMARWVHAGYPSEPPHYEGTHLGTLYRHGSDYLAMSG